MSGSNVRLFVWATSTTSSNLCQATHEASITPAPTALKSAANTTLQNYTSSTTIDGTVVYSPTAYLSIDQIFGIWPPAFAVMSTTRSSWKDIRVTVHPTDLSSVIRTLTDQPWQAVVSSALDKSFPTASWKTINEPYDVGKVQGVVNARDYFLALTKHNPTGRELVKIVTLSVVKRACADQIE